MQRLEGYLLHRRAYRETSMIVTIFTQQQGKLSAMVRGVRSAKSDKKSVLQPFTKLSFTLSGKGNLPNMGHLELEQLAHQLHGENLFCAMYLNELCQRVCPENYQMSALFSAYEHTLTALCLADSTGLEAILREFELLLLDDLGVLPELHLDSQGAEFIAQQHYIYMPEHGVLPVAQPQAQSFAGQALLDMLASHWHADSLAAAKRICRIALQPLLGEKPLKSRELFVR